MKKLIAIVFCLSLFSAYSQTADEVITKYASQMGGLDAFKNVKTVKMTGTVSAQGNELALTTQIVNGKSMRSDIEVMGQAIVNCYSNGKGWKINPFAGAPTPTEVTGSELNDFKIQSMLANQLMDYKARGHQAELQGDEDVEGVKTFKIKFTSKEDGKNTTYYISKADYTLIKSVTLRQIQGQDMEVETYYSDIKDFGGLKFTMQRDQKISGQIFQSIHFEKIELNVPVDEKIFDMPK